MAIMQQDGSLCQYGTDEDIIMRPANRFTFEFIGVSNFIPIVKEGKELCLDCGEKIPYTAHLPADCAGKEMGVRLNDVVFDRDSTLKAEVTSRIFLGSEYNYFLKLGTREIRVQQSMLDARTFGTVAEGEKVGIRFLNPHFYDRKEAAQ
jgi:iron(III) transport system ATP-binding protein